MLMDKRAATGSYVISIILAILFLVIPTYVIVGVLIDKYTNFIATHALEEHLIAYRVFYSRNSIFYTDKTIGRTYTNLIDIERFNEQVINDLLGKISSEIGIGILLEYNNAKNEIYVNKDSYLTALSRHDIYDKIMFKRIIEVKKGNDRHIGVLALDITFRKE